MKVKNRIPLIGTAFLIPAAIFIVMFNVIPFFWNLILSFQTWNGFSDPEFAGFANFISNFKDPLVRKALLNSIIYAFGSTAGSVILGIAFAVLIIRLAQKEGSIFRLILYSPAMLPTAVVGVMFVFFFNAEMGLLNKFLELIGLESLQHVWLQDKATAMACIIFVAIWKNAGTVMLMVFAAMQGIPTSLYECSRLDGASFMQQMTKVVFPLIKPMIQLATVNTLGAQFKSYDLIFTMTQGGPANLTTTVPIVMKKTAFAFGKFGPAASLGVLFTIVVAVSIVLVRRSLRGETYEY